MERRPELVALARHNFDVLGIRNINTVEAEAEHFLEQCPGSFDLIYLDPARRDDRRQRVFQLADCQPNVVALKKRLLAVTSHILVKTAPLLDLKNAMEQLKPVSQVWVVAVDNEVKEVLYLLSANAGQPDEYIPVSAVFLGDYPVEPLQAFTFTQAEEQAARPAYSAVLEYLYEPHAAILKAGAFNTFARRYGLAKLHPNTHLYTSAVPVENAPGRRFRVVATVRYDLKAVKAVLPGGQAHVA